MKELIMGATASVARIGVGSKQWADKLRKRSKHLVTLLEAGNVELGIILWQLHNTPVDGDTKKEANYTRWGYSTFGEFVEVDLGMHRRKAERLRRIGSVLEVELSALDEALRDRAKSIGWSKLRELIKIFANKHDRHTVQEWVSFAEQNNYRAVEAAVGMALDKMGLEDGKASDDVVDDLVDDSVDPWDDSEDADGESDDGDDAEYGRGRLTVKDAADALPPPERMKVWSFTCLNEQIDMVSAALDRAKELSGSDKKSHNLSLVCMDFVATNDFGKPDDPKTKHAYLAKLERLLGVKLIAVGKDDNKVFYGFKALKQLADREEE